MYVELRTKMVVVHLEIADAPKDCIKTVNYLAIEPTPFPTAQEVVDMVKARIPDAKIDFKVGDKIRQLLDVVFRSPSDRRSARQEWG